MLQGSAWQQQGTPGNNSSSSSSSRDFSVQACQVQLCLCMVRFTAHRQHLLSHPHLLLLLLLLLLLEWLITSPTPPTQQHICKLYASSIRCHKPLAPPAALLTSATAGVTYPPLPLSETHALPPSRNMTRTIQAGIAER
jgi:hypothetical protein